MISKQSGKLNMEKDSGLFERAARLTAPTGRVYRWAGRAVTCGCFQDEKAVAQALPADWRMVQVAKRPTAGGAVLHHKDFVVCLVFPVTNESARESYRRIHAAIRDCLAELGWKTELSDAAAGGAAAGSQNNAGLVDAAAKNTDDACGHVRGGFCRASPVECDLMLDGRKVTGGAQRRCGRALLYQGFVDLPVDLKKFSRLLGKKLSAEIKADE